MWKSQEDIPSTSSNESNSIEARTGSSVNLSQKKKFRKDSPGLIQRAISFQILNRQADAEDAAQRAAIKRRYQDISKFFIWPKCRLPDKLPPSKPFYSPSEIPKEPPPMKNLPEPTDPRAVLFRPDIDDHKSPYLACTINDVLRSDSSGSSDEEELMQMTRL